MNELHYRGDCTDIDTTNYVGADRFGAFYQPVSASYDADADRTTIQYRPIPDIARYAADNGHEDRFVDKARIIDLFGGRW